MNRKRKNKAIKMGEQSQKGLIHREKVYEVTKLRAKAHDLAARIWGAWDDPDCDKQQMYQWLKKHSFSEHMGNMQISELRMVIGKLKKYKSQHNGKMKRLNQKKGR